MRIAKAIAASCCLFLTALPAVHAQDEAEQPYLYELVQSNSALAASFKKLTAAVVEESPWVSSYGTAAPAEPVRIDDTEYLLFWGCKPHACVSESYAVLYQPETDEMVAGALLKNSFSEDNNYLQGAEIIWLGETQWDQASLISKHLY